MKISDKNVMELLCLDMLNSTSCSVPDKDI